MASGKIAVFALLCAATFSLAAQAPATNLQLQSAVLQKLLGDPSLNTFVITAAVNNGAVKLNGTVDTTAERDRVIAGVKAIPGVTSVDDQISVGADQLAGTTTGLPPRPVPVAPAADNGNGATVAALEANDPLIKVENALAANPAMTNVSAAVNGPEVSIFGTVNTKSDLTLAAHIAQKAAPGMTVRNLILVYKGGR